MGADDPLEALVASLAAFRSKRITDGQSAEKVDHEVFAALAQGAQVWVEGIQRGEPHRLAQSRRDRRGFERRLLARWGRALDSYEMLRLFYTDLGSDLQQRWAGQPLPLGGARFEALQSLHGRACLCAGAILSLLCSGYPIAAEAQWRTLHELAVVANLLSDADEDICAGYLNHEIVARLKTARRYQASHTRLGEEPLPDELLRHLESRERELVVTHGSGFRGDWGWARRLFGGRAERNQKFSPTFAMLEELAELDHFSAHHAQSSSHIHGGSRGARLTVVDFRDSRMRLAGPSNAGLADPAIGALRSLHQVTVALTMQPALIADDPTLVSKMEAASILLEQTSQSFLEAHARLEGAEESYVVASRAGRERLLRHVGAFTAFAWADASRRWLNDLLFAGADTVTWLRKHSCNLRPQRLSPTPCDPGASDPT